MFGYYLRRVDQRCSPCEFEKNDAVISDICDIPWLTLAYFGLLRVSLTSPPFILPRVSTTISEFNPNVPNVPVSCMSQDGVRDAQYHAIVRYDTVRMYVICAYLRTALVFLILGNLLTSWVPSFGWALLFLLPVAGEVITCLNRGTADFTPPYGQKSLGRVVLRDSLQKWSWPNRLFTSLRTIDRKGSPRLMFSMRTRLHTQSPKQQKVTWKQHLNTRTENHHGLPKCTALLARAVNMQCPAAKVSTGEACGQLWRLGGRGAGLGIDLRWIAWEPGDFMWSWWVQAPETPNNPFPEARHVGLAMWNFCLLRLSLISIGINIINLPKLTSNARIRERQIR